MALMRKNKTASAAETLCKKKYGLPLFGACWIPLPKPKANDNDSSPADASAHGDSKLYLILSGGGGDGRTGIKNALLVANYDFSTDVLSDSMHQYYTDVGTPYRMAVHPQDNTIICGFFSSDGLNGCRLFQLSFDKTDSGTLTIKELGKGKDELKDIGEQKSLVFSRNGLRLATGGEDGHLRVFSWPDLKILFNDSNAHKSIRDLDFSLDGDVLVSMGDNVCNIWSLATLKAISSIKGDKGSSLGFCRFSKNDDKPVLFVTMNRGTKGHIGIWDVHTGKKMKERQVEKNAISAFAISTDGKFLATGTENGISIIEARTMVTYQRVNEAHMVCVTKMEFFHDSRVLVSISADASARVTKIEKQSQGGSFWFLLILFIVLVIALLWEPLVKRVM